MKVEALRQPGLTLELTADALIEYAGKRINIALTTCRLCHALSILPSVRKPSDWRLFERAWYCPICFKKVNP